MKNKYLVILLSVLTITLFVGCGTPRSKLVKIAIEQAKRKEGKKEKVTPKPNTIIKDVEPEVVTIKDVVNPSGKGKIRESDINNLIPPAEGKLIQVEGLIWKEVNELTIDLGVSSNQVEQIIALRDHVKKNWHYVFDPVRGKDTWRSAEATLALKYKGQYPGDCDDYAILMASFARQIGLRSRMVGGYDNGSGHAFAEFLLPSNQSNNPSLRGNDYRTDSNGKWVSLDWFSGSEHNKYTHDIKVFEDI